jgi:1,4-alpha-glucan branching enzyme
MRPGKTLYSKPGGKQMTDKEKFTAAQAKTRKTVTSAKETPSAKPVVKTKAQASIPTTEFKLVAPDAKEVFLAGDFNDWNPTEYRLRRYKDGIYKKKLQLKPGRYQYLFRVDGEWWTDPEHPERTSNPFGSENSVITVS